MYSDLNIGVENTHDSPLRSLLNYIPQNYSEGELNYKAFREIAAKGFENGYLKCIDVSETKHKNRKRRYPNGKSKELSKKIILLRKQLKVTVPELSEIINVSAHHIYSCEHNRTDIDKQKLLLEKLKQLTLNKNYETRTHKNDD